MGEASEEPRFEWNPDGARELRSSSWCRRGGARGKQQARWQVAGAVLLAWGRRWATGRLCGRLGETPGRCSHARSRAARVGFFARAAPNSGMGGLCSKSEAAWSGCAASAGTWSASSSCVCLHTRRGEGFCRLCVGMSSQTRNRCVIEAVVPGSVGAVRGRRRVALHVGSELRHEGCDAVNGCSCGPCGRRQSRRRGE